ncbi:MAG: 4Fe-4S dicluster domain-containing protein [Candidatus Alcyoniella australis]|nr:4Fe-4S dicluster domain-containing protein [Candidatus Alcyoniella australis]
MRREAIISEHAQHPNSDLLDEINARGHANVARCFNCGKCSGGCPLAFAMEFGPQQIVRMVQLGMRDALLHSHAIWVCASCQTCTARCPNEVDVAGLIDELRRMSLEAGLEPAEPRVAQFHRAFLETVQRSGRAHELELTARFKLAARDPLGDARLGLELLRRGKLKLTQGKVRGRDEVRRILDRPKGS